MRPLHFADTTGDYTERGITAGSRMKGGSQKALIGLPTAILMVSVSVIVDTLQLFLLLLNFVLPVVGAMLSMFLTIMAGILFVLWFLLIAAGNMGSGIGRTFWALAGISVGEMIPFINGFPVLSIGMFFLVRRLRKARSGYTGFNGFTVRER